MKRTLPILLIMCLVPNQFINAQIFTPPSAPKPKSKPAPRPTPNPQPVAAKPVRKLLAKAPVAVGPQERTSGAQTFLLSRIGGMDSYIRSSLPSALWSKETAIIVGGWGDEYRGLVWFDVNRLPEIAEGYSVKLYLYERAPDDGSANRPTSMLSYRAESQISAQTAWKNRPEVEKDSEWEREVTGEGWLALDITSYVESWRAGAPNYGIVLVPRSTNNKFNFFIASDDAARLSLQPYIRVERDVESAAVAGDAAEELYKDGFRLFAANALPDAQAKLKEFTGKFPITHKRWSYAQNLLGRAYLDDGKPALAAVAFYDNYQKAPRGDQAAESLSWLALAMIRLKNRLMPVVFLVN